MEKNSDHNWTLIATNLVAPVSYQKGLHEETPNRLPVSGNYLRIAVTDFGICRQAREGKREFLTQKSLNLDRNFRESELSNN